MILTGSTRVEKTHITTSISNRNIINILPKDMARGAAGMVAMTAVTTIGVVSMIEAGNPIMMAEDVGIDSPLV